MSSAREAQSSLTYGFAVAARPNKPPAESWNPDGWSARTRIGVLVPHADVGPESELRAMAPAGVGIHAARVPFGAMGQGGRMDPTIAHGPVREFAEAPELEQAAELLAAAPIDAIAFGFTSSAYVIGEAGESEMIERLRARTKGIPVVATVAGIVEGLQALDASRIVLVSPPWFDAELDALGARYFEAAGFTVVDSSPCGLPSAQHQITPEALHEWISSRRHGDADAVVVGGNGFRAVGAIEATERATGKPMLTANQALLWASLRAAGGDPREVRGYGRLFEAL